MKYLKTFNENNTMEKISSIDSNVKINDYIKSDLIYKNNRYNFIDEEDKIKHLNIEFIGDDIIILNNEKLKLSKEIINPGDSYFDTRYPNEILTLSTHAKGIEVPFGFRKWMISSKNNKYVDGNDCVFKADII